MTRDDIEAEFSPRRSAPPVDEQERWCLLIAQALASYPGSAAAVFRNGSGGWKLVELHWFPPGKTAFQTAGRAATAPLRALVAAGLRAAGKNVVAEPDEPAAASRREAEACPGRPRPDPPH